MKIRRCVGAFACVLLLGGFVTARDAHAQGAGPAHFEDTAHHVHVIAATRTSTEGRAQLVVRLAIDRGFHVNANPASEEDLIATTLHLIGVRPLRVTYPKPLLFKLEFLHESLAVYEGIIDIVADLPSEPLPSPLTGTITAQACTDQICLPPADLPVSAD